MANFMFVYRGGDDKVEELSPEEMQGVMQLWMVWMENGGREGWLVDGGDALKGEGRVVQANGSVTDGPFAESKELVGGYSMIKAADFDAACKIAQSNPVLKSGGTVEIRELAGLSAKEN